MGVDKILRITGEYMALHLRGHPLDAYMLASSLSVLGKTRTVETHQNSSSNFHFVLNIHLQFVSCRSDQIIPAFLVRRESTLTVLFARQF